MKKLLFILLFPMCLSAQQKAFVASPYVVLIDTTTKFVETYQQTAFNNNYSMFIKGGYTRLFDCYDGIIFSFADTLVTGDIAQVASTGVYKITPHSAPISTTKRDILVKDIMLNYNTSTQTLIPPSTYGEPLIIVNTTTQKESVRIYMNGNMFWSVLPTTFSLFTATIKKIVVN